jgi:trigger factor
MKTNQKKLPKSQIEIEFELTAEEFEHYIGHALSHMKSHVKVDGFRPGQAPNKLVEEKIKPESLLMEAGDHAVRHVYSDYVKDNNLEPIGQPDVKIVKIAKGNPFVFTATITVLPDVELPDYKEITKKIKANKEILVTDEEVQDALNYLQKTRAKFIAKNEEAQKGDFVEIIYQNKDINAGKEVDDKFILGEGGFMKGFEESIVGMKAGEEKEFKVMFPENNPNKGLAGKEGDFKVKLKSVQKMELPEIDNEFAKGMGAFDTLVALKQSMKEGMIIEKTEQEKQRKRGEILEKIGEKVKLELPEAMVDYEKQRLLEDLKNKITQNMKITFEQYLQAVKQTEEALTQTFQKEAEKRLKGFLVLRELGKKENIEVLDAEVEEEVLKSTKIYSKEDLKKIDIEQLKEYTKGVLYNEKVFQKLESFSE